MIRPSMRQVSNYFINTNVQTISNLSKQEVKQLTYNEELSMCLAGKQITRRQ